MLQEKGLDDNAENASVNTFNTVAIELGAVIASQVAESEGEASWNPEGFVADFEAATGEKQKVVGTLWCIRRARVVLLTQRVSSCSLEVRVRGEIKRGTYNAGHIWKCHLVIGLHAEPCFFNSCLRGFVGWIENAAKTINSNGEPSFCRRVGALKFVCVVHGRWRGSTPRALKYF